MLGKGFTTATSDSVVGVSGAPTVVYGLNIVSGGGGAGRVILRNGATTGGTAVITLDGTTSKGVQFDFGGQRESYSPPAALPTSIRMSAPMTHHRRVALIWPRVPVKAGYQILAASAALGAASVSGCSVLPEHCFRRKPPAP